MGRIWCSRGAVLSHSPIPHSCTASSQLSMAGQQTFQQYGHTNKVYWKFFELWFTILKGHPNIVHLIDAAWHRMPTGMYEVFILMEFCSGKCSQRLDCSILTMSCRWRNNRHDEQASP